ncbi:protealysin inhibitor emfourin [Microbacterium allomyrinae]|uniref:Uncharacterized protein n=1 Tax=Microbacterium allomyrinae TaxID=2830666 RepID=A0A9X1LWT2_9MICO|nr:protealysin inhibitor emfourin [Microbacterium allomyrinae]MCC2033489.1 hypothetical protein [Microbacterium allomyrinae]
MDQTPRTDRGQGPSAPAATPEPAVEVDVARTGGFAGLTRRWSAQPPEDQASEWIVLLDRCPWDDAPAIAAHPNEPGDKGLVAERAQQSPIADGFVWWIRARWSDPSAGAADRREAELAEDQVTGAWRELVDAVRSWNSGATASPDAERPGR